MQFKTLFACASFVAAAVAQSNRIAFAGTIPTTVQAGVTVPISFAGGNGNPVTITLQQGERTNLQNVTVLTVSQTGNPYNWIPSSALTNGENYALRIDQEGSEPNYTGLITLTGGQSASSSGSTTAVSSVASVISSALDAISSPSAGPVASANATTTAVVSTNTVATQIVGTGVVGTGVVGTGVGASGSAATGTAMYRNSTMSSATLTRSSTASSSAAATTSSDSESSSTSEESAPSSTAGSGAAVTAASNFALLCAAVVGVMYLA